ncbi:MAG: (Fe-S)-binding protein [Candidatus Parabeggiatoa sp. nov. 3]|nr:MAG: (Fe-S)-binding protein [Gammaproteobacteria bacterium]RKZ81056.1 MAG: (Fe-S)-binding protein [Gammaproteobacteria bacterium]HEW98868.1 (Fe-S)-binding protein [Beggiatoa sp.]
MSITKKPTHRVGLFVTCLVDLFRPNVGFATIKLLEKAGCQVEIPTAQTCCGQPAYNNGDLANTRQIAQQVINHFDEFDYIVAPSGSCAAMLKHHYPQLFKDDAQWEAKAQAFANRCYELVSFLTDVCGMTQISAQFEHTVTYHDACSGLRELGIHAQPRKLLNTVQGCQIKEMKEAEVCCGFGGTFCVKYPDISARMVSDKVAHIEATESEVLLAGDMGCLLNIAGRLKRLKSPVKVYHIAEVLAEMANVPAIGEGES